GGGFGGGGRGGGGLGRNTPQPPTDAQLGAVNTKDLDKVNPITVMLDKKKDLKLPDSTVKLFKQMESMLRDTNKVRYKVIDSLNKQLRPKDYQKPTDDDRVRAENARHLLDAATGEIRARYDSAQAKGFTYLSQDQQIKATAYIQQVISDVQQSEQDALRPSSGGGGFTMGSSRGGGRGGGGGGGGTRGGAFGDSNREAVVSSSDLQKLNPITIILSKRTDLGLEDSTVAKLDDMNRVLVASILPQLKALDSLGALAPQGGFGTARPSSSNPQIDSVVTIIHARFDVAQSAAFSLLSPVQVSAAALLIEQAKASATHSGRGP
ncbi:MAG TPA: hypothetical protein VMH39_15605, partial [Gemmatimonadaceae bacterium]|nr:hypothetical protein [Gemmatimonadaceae bacterium]